MKILEGKEKEYKDWYDKNSDRYGRGCFTYAEKWAELMEEEIDKSESAEKAIFENALNLSYVANEEGITGFMYGVAVCILSSCWKYGDILNKWHNKRYNYDGEGTVNPAIITVEKDK